MSFIFGFITGAILFTVIWWNVRPDAIGTIFIFEDDSMYVQLDDEESFYKMHEKPYAMFRLKHRHSQK